jgi:hypothetical protein
MVASSSPIPRRAQPVVQVRQLAVNVALVDDQFAVLYAHRGGPSAGIQGIPGIPDVIIMLATLTLTLTLTLTPTLTLTLTLALALALFVTSVQ